jgi:type II secretory pathway pseudopilin PulG
MKNLLLNKNGWTLIEMGVVLTVMGIILYYSIPQFHKAFEQSRIDIAATNLQAIWTAQRLYCSQNHKFTAKLEELETAGLLDSGFVKRINGLDSPFAYYVSSADDVSFEVLAERINSTWSGRITINEQGIVVGQVQSSNGTVITATKM